MTQADKARELLKDRQDYRQALIHRRNEWDAKLKAVEEEISKLRGMAK